MVSRETTRLLRWHAGLDDVPPLEVKSICWCATRERHLDGLDEALASFLEGMSSLNRELNGDVPSEVVTGGADAIPISVAYAVAEVSRWLRDYEGDEEGRGRASEAAWLVDAAWSAVQAGDIDDIAQHVRDQASARR